MDLCNAADENTEFYPNEMLSPSFECEVWVPVAVQSRYWNLDAA